MKINREINKIIIHCSDSDYLTHDNIEVIRSWHKARMFSDVGYHYFIDKAGILHKGRDLSTIGAHCAGHNKDSIGICFSGKNHFSAQQMMTGQLLLDVLLGMFNLKARDVFPHNHFNHGKTCPNFDVSLLFRQ